MNETVCVVVRLFVCFVCLCTFVSACLFVCFFANLFVCLCVCLLVCSRVSTVCLVAFRVLVW